MTQDFELDVTNYTGKPDSVVLTNKPEPITTTDEWVTRSEICDTLGIRPTTLLKRISRGEVEAKGVSSSRRFRVAQPKLEQAQQKSEITVCVPYNDGYMVVTGLTAQEVLCLMKS